MKARRIVAVAVFFAGASALTTGPAYAEVLCSCCVGSFVGLRVWSRRRCDKHKASGWLPIPSNGHAVP